MGGLSFRYGLRLKRCRRQARLLMTSVAPLFGSRGPRFRAILIRPLVFFFYFFFQMRGAERGNGFGAAGLVGTSLCGQSAETRAIGFRKDILSIIWFFIGFI